MLKSHWANLKYLLTHKWFVALECAKLGLYWQALVHDLSKFRPSEWNAYAEFFSCPLDPKPEDVRGRFIDAWAAHLRRNPHHWQYWVTPKDTGGRHVLRMPEKYAKEMVADWRGASLALKGRDESREWYLERRKTILLHPETRKLVEELLGITPVVTRE